jgi:hypothetical protein
MHGAACCCDSFVSPLQRTPQQSLRCCWLSCRESRICLLQLQPAGFGMTRYGLSDGFIGIVAA